jgi:hypothetical protein
MFSDYQEFGWEFIEKKYMPTGRIERFFDYMKAMKTMAHKVAKANVKDDSFEKKVHGDVQKHSYHAPPGKRHITYIRDVVLPPGAEDETFD